MSRNVYERGTVQQSFDNQAQIRPSKITSNISAENKGRLRWPERWRPMISQMSQGAGGDAEPRSDANSADRLMSPKNVVEAALQTMRSQRTTVRSAPKVMRIADVRELDAYVERRRKLAA